MSDLILASADIREPLLNSPVGAFLHWLCHGGKFPVKPGQCAHSSPDELALACPVELVGDAAPCSAADKVCSDEPGFSSSLQPQAKSRGDSIFAAGSRPNDQKKQTKPNVFFCLAKGSRVCAKSQPSEGQARRRVERKRSLLVVNEHSEPLFNAASPSAGTFRTEPKHSGLVAWNAGKQAVACTEWLGKLNFSAGSFPDSLRVQSKATWLRRRMAGYRYRQKTVRARMVRRRH